MIHHRTRGILRLRLAIECVAVAALFWVWFASYTAIVPSGGGVAAGPYRDYLAALLAGLVLETFTADFNKAIRQIQDPGLAAQLQTSVRQTCFSFGVLFLFLMLTKDRFMSRFFLVIFLPAEFLLLEYWAATEPWQSRDPAALQDNFEFTSSSDISRKSAGELRNSDSQR